MDEKIQENLKACNKNLGAEDISSILLNIDDTRIKKVLEMKRKRRYDLLINYIVKTELAWNESILEHPIIKNDADFYEKLVKVVNLLPTPPMTENIQRDIIKRLCARQLDKLFCTTFLELIEEVQQEYIAATHKVGIRCIINLREESEEPYFTLSPFKCIGRTNNYPIFLKTITYLEANLLITLPPIRKTFKFCVQNLQSCLIDFTKYRDTVYDISQLQIIFDNDMEVAKYAIHTWYRHVKAYICDDEYQITPKLHFNFLNCANVLISIHLSHTLRTTIEHLIYVTKNAQLMPYMKMDLIFDSKIAVLPSIMEICNLYVQLVDKITSLANDLPSLKSYHYRSHRKELVSVFITAQLQNDYKLEIKHNIMLIFIPIMKHIRFLNVEFSGIFNEYQKWMSWINSSSNVNKTGLVRRNREERPTGGKESFEPTDINFISTFCDLQELGLELECIEEDVGEAGTLNLDISFEDGCAKVNIYRTFLKRVSSMLNIEHYLIGQLIQIPCINSLTDALNNMVDKVTHVLILQHTWLNDDICQHFEMIVVRANTLPQTAEELVELSTFLHYTSKQAVVELQSKLETSVSLATSLIEIASLTEEYFALHSTTINWAFRITPILEQFTAKIEIYKSDFEEHLHKVTDKLCTDINEFLPQLHIINEMDDACKVNQYLEYLTKLVIKASEFDRIQKGINKDETAFKFPLTAVSNLTDLKNLLYPFSRLIQVCSLWFRSFGAWMHGPFEFLNFTQTELDVGSFLEELRQTQKMYMSKIPEASAEKRCLNFKGDVDDPDPNCHPAPIKLCAKVLEAIDNFKPNLKMMKIMCNDALLQRHWNKMSEIAGFDLTPNSGTTLCKLMNLGLQDAVDKYEIISIGATKEKALLYNLHKMQNEWEDLSFRIITDGDVGIPILDEVDEANIILGDHIMQIQSMRCSIFIQPYEAEIKNWSETITCVNRTLDAWYEIQIQILKFIPIFSCNDIRKYIPEENDLFKNVERIYKLCINIIRKCPKIIKSAGKPELLNNLLVCIGFLEKIKEGTVVYLENKRNIFPRFFFLSDNELLKIIIESKNHISTQRRFKRCFENIDMLHYDEKLRLHGTISKEGEKLIFSTIIPIEDKIEYIEKFLRRIERATITAVRDHITKASIDYQNVERPKFIKRWPGQIVLVISQISWTKTTHYLLGKPRSLFSLFINSLKQDFNDVIDIIRQENITNLTRITAKSLIITDSHAMNVAQYLYDANVENSSDFKWISQIRYYLEGDCEVRILNATIKYAYEYLGNTCHLVITPLTERCYKSLITAYQLHLNCSIEGPSGIGKSETIKEFSKAIAVYCIMFNCSEELKCETIMRYLKGVAASGAWVCFDEFNRIQVEVLSVVVEQLLCIFTAAKADKEQAVINGTELILNHHCFVCITMNPSYCSRSMLPNNLKMLCRSIVMIEPNYQIIIEITLYSLGFKYAALLSRKIATLYCFCVDISVGLCDLRIREIKSILSACEYNRFDYPDENEDVIILKSIVSVSLPKLSKRNLPLFEEILFDLFPNVHLPSTNYNDLVTALGESCIKQNLQQEKYFINKIVQIYEIMKVHHGFILIGDPFAGKTSALVTLADALTILYRSSQQKVQFQYINPKSINIEQLYGYYDTMSHDWLDGVFTNCFRRYVADTCKDKGWIIFDGPIDSIWIENINTVLDDTKTLCLPSGEVIAVNNNTSIIFEVMDLNEASPSTISRCGVNYMEPLSLGWQPHVHSWLNTCDKGWCESNKNLLLDLFNWIVPPSLQFIRKHCHKMCNPGEINLLKSMTCILKMVMSDAYNENSKNDDDFKYITSWIQAAFTYSAIWGLASVLDYPSKEKYDEFYKTIWRGKDWNNPYPPGIEKTEISVPFDGLIFDYIYIFKSKGNWKNCSEIIKTIKIDETQNLENNLIPTADTVKYGHIVDMHVRYSNPLLLVGSTGTGKTYYMQHYLEKILNQDNHEFAFISLSIGISASQIQNMILSKLKQFKHGHYGPSRQKYVLFIDDLSNPLKDAYGTQPPLELLRQHLDNRQWYNLKDCTLVHIRDMLIIAAMTPSNTKLKDICSRVLRHFGIFSIAEFSDDTITRIFTNILLTGLRNNGFPSDVIQYVKQIVAATLNIHKLVITSLRPTLTKSHYIFNLKDFSNIILGCALLRKESVDSKILFPKIWVHEVLRIICDRLVNSKDKNLVFAEIKTSVNDIFNEDFDKIFEYLKSTAETENNEEVLQNLIFGSYLNTSNKYEEICNTETIQSLAQRCLDTYNSTHPGQMEIVLFEYALQHLFKICRIISMPKSNAVLIGVSGCGRRSLTKLATAILEFSFFQPKITTNYDLNKWRTNIKEVLKEAGGKGKHTIFLIADEELNKNEFLEDIHYLLIAGEITGLFTIDEQRENLELTRLAAQGGNENLDISAAEVFSYFVKTVQKKLHIVLCINLIGIRLRTIIHNYPSLVHCCTMNWFSDWPENALEKVANHWMKDVKIAEGTKGSVITVFKYFHTTSQEIYDNFFKETGIKVYNTSASYLQLIIIFNHLVHKRQHDLTSAKIKYTAGLQKLQCAAAQITIMQKSLEDYELQLKEMREQAKVMMKQIETETIQVEKASDLVRKDEQISNIQAAEAQKLKAECEADLAEAIPILEDAIAALNTLKPTDITLVKSMKNPPDAIKLVMAAVCVIKEVKPDRFPDPSTGRKKIDYWGPSKRILGDIAFLQSLKEFDKDNIKPEVMTKIRRDYLPHKDFKPHIVAKASSAAQGLCKWIIAMNMYDKVAKEVAPKKTKLEEAERKYAATMTVLLEKKEEVRRLEQKLFDLNTLLEEATTKQRNLESRVDLCTHKLQQANKLMDGLSGEKSRWTNATDVLNCQFTCLEGDNLLSSGFIAYLSPLNKNWRSNILKNWLEYLKNFKVSFSDNYDFFLTLSSETEIHELQFNGLPQDSFFTDNAIILENSKLWPLLIDPQSYANTWLKIVEKKNDICVAQLTDDDCLSNICYCVETGKPILIENIEHSLDSALNPLCPRFSLKEDSIVNIICEKKISYHPNFKLYMTSKLKKPRYPPEVFNKVIVINFIYTKNALENQLLDIIVSKLRPELQKERDMLLREIVANKISLAEVDATILKTLAQTKEDILEDEISIKILDKAKARAVDILEKQILVQQDREDIESYRLQYKSIATHSTVLYCCISYLSTINPMYQYSLTWFIHLYLNAIQNCYVTKDLSKKLKLLKEELTLDLYETVCRSLFEKDKLIFSFLLCVEILISKDNILREELQLLLTSTNNKIYSQPYSSPEWIDNKTWDEIIHLEQVESFQGIQESFIKSSDQWKVFYNNSQITDCTLPHPWENRLSLFQKLLLLKALKPNQLLSAVKKFIENEMGRKFISSPLFDISRSFQSSNCLTPLVIILSEETEVISILQEFSRVNGFGRKFRYISLGYGQKPAILALLNEGIRDGLWICVQNCHLDRFTMRNLEKIYQQMNISNTHLQFRLWLTTSDSDDFPLSILENSVKLMKESSYNISKNILQLYLGSPLNNVLFYSGCPGKEIMFTRLLYSITVYHTIIQGRYNFHATVWNTPYNFNELDYTTTVQQLQIIINEYDEPYEILSNLIGECNYNVISKNDHRLIISLLKKYINAEVVNNINYKFFPERYNSTLSRIVEHEEYVRYIKSTPREYTPELFGLDQNASIIRDLDSTSEIMKSITSIYGEYKNHDNKESQVLQLLTDILLTLPESLKLDENEYKPPQYYDSLNLILIQEIENYTKLLKLVRNTLKTTENAIKGLATSIPNTETLQESILSGKVPKSWLQVSYPSSKSLPRYISDLAERIRFIENWNSSTKPNPFWFPGLFRPIRFLFGIRQNYARKYCIPIYQIMLDFEIQKTDPDQQIPEDGIPIYGLFLHGARWDKAKSMLNASLHNTFYDAMPLMWIIPIPDYKYVKSEGYLCPLYNTFKQAAINTQPNYVISIPLDTDLNPSHWIERGITLLCQVE